VDTLIGQLLDHLEKTGLYDSALVVITADHGASSGPGCREGDRKSPVSTT
jgi:arylsulfatase A-like enzyme